MVLLPKQWKSRSSPGFAGGVEQNPFAMFSKPLPGNRAAALSFWRGVEQPAAVPLCGTGTKGARGGLVAASQNAVGAGWSSPVARQAHNLKVAGSNPAPATNPSARFRAGFFVALARLAVQPSNSTRPLARS